MSQRIPVQPLRRRFEMMVLLAALATIPLIIAQERGINTPTVFVLDWLIWAVFLADYSANLIWSSNRPAFVRRRWLDLAVVVLSFPTLPAFLGLLRLARIVRLTRLVRLQVVTARGLTALRATLGRPGLLYLAGATAVLVFVCGGLLTIIEPETVKGKFSNGVWWAIVTTTTVGYGDIYPVTGIGRLLAVLLMFAGIGLFSTLAGSVAAYFVKEEEAAGANGLVARLDKLEALVRGLAEQRSRVEEGVGLAITEVCLCLSLSALWRPFTEHEKAAGTGKS